MTFGGHAPFAKLGDTDVAGARRLLDMCLEAGVNMVDTADIYSEGRSEEIVGEILRARRERLLLASKVRRCSGHT